jgi:hypothetical protein
VYGDKDVCQKVADSVGSDAPVKKAMDREMHFVCFNSPDLAESVGQYGAVPKKSRIIPFPDIPGDMVSHFLRGFFDADGCVHFSRRKNRDGSVSRDYPILSITSASRKFMDKTLERVAAVTGSKSSLIDAKDGTYRISVSCQHAIKLSAWLWKDSKTENRGDRKFDLAQTFKNYDGAKYFLSDQEKAEIVKMYTTGMTSKEVARKIGRSLSPVLEVLRSFGVVRNGINRSWKKAA